MLINNKYLREYFFVFVGTFLLAISVRYFILPFDILSGGVAGIAVALSPLVHLDAEVIIYILMIVLLLAGGLVLGKAFLAKTIFSSLLYPLLLSILMNFPFALEIPVVLASLYSGIIAGAGIGLVFRVEASTGGVDIPVLIINKWTNIPIPRLTLLVDALVVILGVLTYGIEAVLVGMLSVYACAFMIDQVLFFGSHSAKSVQIISNQYEQLAEIIQVDLDRGITLVSAEGGYSRKKRPIILVAIEAKEYPHLLNLINQVDEEAFIITNDANEVRGNGFSSSVRV
ncbi:MAG: YitT family protein [Erysipelotrichaceae bacterium]